MSKGLGRKIAIKFTEEITVFSETPLTDITTNQGILTALGTYGTTNVVNRLKDGSTSTYWETRTTSNYVRIDYNEPKIVKSVRWYTGSSYRPSTFRIEKSDNGVDFTTALEGTSGAVTGWQQFDFVEPITAQYLRIVFTSIATRLYLYELETIISDYAHSVGEFTVSGQREEYIGGPLVAEEYVIKRVMRHPTELKALLLEFDPVLRFNNAVGLVTVSYDKTIGNLQGVGGVVESFSETFMPTELVPVPNPYHSELITVDATATVILTRVYYTDAPGDDTLEISATATATLWLASEAPV